MRVQRVRMVHSGLESWTVLGDDHVPLPPVERYLSHLSLTQRSPNTVKAYAHDLKDWFVYLTAHGLDWRDAQLEHVGWFVAWLLLPPKARGGQLLVLPSVEAHCAEGTVDRKLSALVAFYEFHARHGVQLAGALVTMRHGGRRAMSWKPFMYHISRGAPQRRRTIKLKAPKPRPRVLKPGQVQAILDACDHLRDRLLFGVLYDTGSGLGKRLGCDTRTFE